MANEIMPTVTELPVADIEMTDRLRPVSEAGVAALIASIGELGVMKDPIHVRRMPKGRWRIMAGGHRLTAAQRLGWETIQVTAWRCGENFARMMEIDDNLAGAELTALDTAVFLAARKRVYEALHPETKAATGAVLAGKRWNASDTMSLASFADATAEKLGKSKRHVERLVRAGEAISGHAHQLRSAPRPVALADLMEISKIGDLSERYAVVEALEAGTAPSAAKARKAYAAEQGRGPTPLSDHDAKLMKLIDAWSRAGKRARRAFLEECGTDVRALLDEMGDG